MGIHPPADRQLHDPPDRAPAWELETGYPRDAFQQSAARARAFHDGEKDDLWDQRTRRSGPLILVISTAPAGPWSCGRYSLRTTLLTILEKSTQTSTEAVTPADWSR